jgi:uncharacterized protein (TIGR03435 family)
MWLRVGCFAAAFALYAAAQRPVFEVASVKPGNPQTGMLRSLITPGNFRAENATLRILMEDAYQLKPFQLTGGPRWLDQDRFEIIAKAGKSATEDQIRLMVQALLEDRFRLVLRREKKEQTISYLTVKGQPKLKPSKEGIREWSSTTAEREGTVNHVSFYATTMSRLADMLSRQLGHMVTDRTGLTGPFDFEFDATRGENAVNMFFAPWAPSLGQIGLKLETGKGPVEFLAIERAEKPSGN